MKLTIITMVFRCLEVATHLSSMAFDLELRLAVLPFVELNLVLEALLE